MCFGRKTRKEYNVVMALALAVEIEMNRTSKQDVVRQSLQRRATKEKQCKDNGKTFILNTRDAELNQ